MHKHRTIFRLSLPFTALILAWLTSCLRYEPMTTDAIDFYIMSRDYDEVGTRATVVDALALVSSGFNVSCVNGTPGSDAQVWTNSAFSRSGQKYVGNRFWPAEDDSYRFYASNDTLTYTAAGATVAATNATDVICAYNGSPLYHSSNQLNFKHIFARLGDVTVSPASGYTISDVTINITPKTGGTYNLRTGNGQTDGTGWSSTTTGSAVNIAPSASGTKTNDVYLVPGVYTLTATWTASSADSSYSKTFSSKTYDVTIVGGAVNDISATLSGDATAVEFNVALTPWERELIAVGTYPVQNPPVSALKFTNVGASNSVQISLSRNGVSPSLEYSTDGTTWSSWNYSGITIAPDESIYIRGNNPSGFSTTFDKYSKFTFSGSSTVACSGDIMTLINYENPPRTIPCTYCFRSLFDGCTSLTEAPELPATTLESSCYMSMFQGCTSLTTAPELPATTLVSDCYGYMFNGCTSLTEAPELPATTLAGNCYRYMFQNCTSLTTPPELPATTLENSCYYQMFYGCTALIRTPELPATTLENGCYAGMFIGCTSLTSAPEILPATTLKDYCYQTMFFGCTSLTTAPVLPAVTLSQYCYDNMFNGCSSLNYIKAMFTTNPGYYNTYYWLNGVSSTGTFIKNSTAAWGTRGVNGIPYNWTIQTASN